MRYITENEANKLFDEFIDEVTGTISILGMNYCASTVLKECDPTAYSCEQDNWLDANNLTTDQDYNETENEAN